MKTVNLRTGQSWDPRPATWRAKLSLALLAVLLVPTVMAVAPVELRFTLPVDARNPFARDLWAEVVTPSGEILRLPVFFLGRDQFAVRARAAEKGEYRLGRVTEHTTDGADAPLVAKAVGGDRRTVTERETLRPVLRSPADRTRLTFSDGTLFTPVGANVAWPPNNRLKYYGSAFARFQEEHLNWMRVWMAHWSGLNLDWFSRSSGTLDLPVADEWDKIVAGAEEHGVYVQLVLQHHGQYSSTVNSNWAANPWNAANAGGFLKSPTEFFTSAKARELTEWKYRYIVARWGYSPAILAWELFNEVHWTDAYKLDHREDAVAAWHGAMAQFLRRTDAYHHLVTTSTENLESPIYAEMDYFQPHLYSADVIAGARSFAPPPDQLDRPVFYGEMGDDHLPLSAEQKTSGISIVPPVWASLMGRGKLPAQPWLGADLIDRNRLGELGAVARFIEATKLDQRTNLTCFSAVVDSASHQPLTIEGVQRWQRHAAPEIDLPLDGRQLPEFANIPQIYVGAAKGRADGFPDRATFRLDAPRELNARAVISGMSEGPAFIRVSIDGKNVIETSWTPKSAEAPSPAHPARLPFRIPSGHHTLVMENPMGPGWFELAGIDLDLEVSVLAAVGQRRDDFIALWVWHRTNVYALQPTAAVTGNVLLEAVPAGRWQVTWWDTVKGVPSAPTTIEHAGGMLLLSTPPIVRHAAVALIKM